MTDDRIHRRLDDLVRFAAEAAYLVGKGREAYRADTMDGAMLRNAGERILIKTATVAEKLPDDFKTQHPSVDWAGINRMRNLVAHYDKVNDDLLWQALTVRIPKPHSRSRALGRGRLRLDDQHRRRCVALAATTNRMARRSKG